MWAWANRTTAGDVGEHLVGPVADLFEGLAADDRVGPHRPTGDRLAHLVRALALGDAVVPLDEVRVDMGPGAESGQHARVAGPLERAHQDQRVLDAGEAGEHRPQSLGEASPLVVERDVGAPGVTTGTRTTRSAIGG
jgi:hypothetical protein